MLLLIYLLNFLSAVLTDSGDPRAFSLKMRPQLISILENVLAPTREGALWQQRAAALFYVFLVVLIVIGVRTDFTFEFKFVHRE
jgi:hypothetical protein